MSAHSILPPSSAHIWGACPGFVSIKDIPEQPPTPASLEGDAVHDYGGRIICGGLDNFPKEDEIHEETGVVMTSELREMSLSYANLVADCVRRIPVRKGGVEKRLEIPDIHPKCFGTCDFHMISFQVNQIHVWELKTGYSEVSAFENKQMLCYLSGILHKYGMIDTETTVFFHVYQPRCFREKPVDTWMFRASDMRGEINKLKNAAYQALGDSPQCNSGPHCKNCDGKYICKAAIQAGAQLYEVTADAVPLDMDDSSLGLQFAIVDRAFEHIKALRTGLQTIVENRVFSGKHIPGYGVEYKYGNRQWAIPDNAIIDIAAEYGVDVTKKGVSSPNQAEILGLDKEIVKSLVARKKSQKLTKNIQQLAKRTFYE